MRLLVILTAAVSLAACNLPPPNPHAGPAMMMMGGQMMQNAMRPPAPTYVPSGPSYSNCQVWRNGNVTCSHN